MENIIPQKLSNEAIRYATALEAMGFPQKQAREFAADFDKKSIDYKKATLAIAESCSTVGVPPRFYLDLERLATEPLKLPDWNKGIPMMEDKKGSKQWRESASTSIEIRLESWEGISDSQRKAQFEGIKKALEAAAAKCVNIKPESLKLSFDAIELYDRSFFIKKDYGITVRATMTTHRPVTESGKEIVGMFKY